MPLTTEMSADTTPISAERFSAALRSLPTSTLHLKLLELRNSLAHLAYSNEQLEEFAAAGDEDCAEAIRENEAVMGRMAERVELVRHEVVAERGLAWETFASMDLDQLVRTEEEEEEKNGGLSEQQQQQQERTENNMNGNSTPAPAATADDPAPARHPAWSDGTFQLGTLRNGTITYENGQVEDFRRLAADPSAPSDHAAGPQGGRRSDADLRQAMEQRIRELELEEGQEQDGGGLHL